MLYLCVPTVFLPLLRRQKLDFLLNNSLGEPGPVGVLGAGQPTGGCEALPSHSPYGTEV